jgi:1,2-dihydroxy-3-keto-5-methylthiopentene dioxygenase
MPLEAPAWQPRIDALMAERGYVKQDVVALGPDTPNLEALCAKFVDEHHHTEDEVRFTLDGEGIFDIRSRDDRWMRVTVEPGDLLVVPANRHHRFFLTDKKTIRCVRLFQTPDGWVAHYRAQKSAAPAK